MNSTKELCWGGHTRPHGISFQVVRRRAGSVSEQESNPLSRGGTLDMLAQLNTNLRMFRRVNQHQVIVGQWPKPQRLSYARCLNLVAAIQEFLS